MAYQRNTLHIHFFMKRAFFVPVPFLPCSEMLQYEPAARIYIRFFKVSMSVPAVIEKVLIQRCDDVAATCKQFSEIDKASVGRISHYTGSMYNNDQGKRTFAIGKPDTAVNRQPCLIETPIKCACE